MTQPPPSLAGPDARGLFALFPPAEFFARSDLVSPDELPQPYHKLLAHEHHMTVTLEEHHGEPVELKVIEQRQGENAYARKLLLLSERSRRVVMFGLMRIHFRHFSPEVKAEVLGTQIPLGRVLINHGVTRRIQTIAFLKIDPAPALCRWFALDAPRQTYGRLAMIHCDERPAIELLEVVAPE
jgi:hypothetical protein